MDRSLPTTQSKPEFVWTNPTTYHSLLISSPDLPFPTSWTPFSKPPSQPAPPPVASSPPASAPIPIAASKRTEDLEDANNPFRDSEDATPKSATATQSCHSLYANRSAPLSSSSDLNRRSQSSHSTFPPPASSPRASANFPPFALPNAHLRRRSPSSATSPSLSASACDPFPPALKSPESSDCDSGADWDLDEWETVDRDAKDEWEEVVVSDLESKDPWGDEDFVPSLRGRIHGVVPRQEGDHVTKSPTPRASKKQDKQGLSADEETRLKELTAQLARLEGLVASQQQQGHQRGRSGVVSRLWGGSSSGEEEQTGSDSEEARKAQMQRIQKEMKELQSRREVVFPGGLAGDW